MNVMRKNYVSRSGIGTHKEMDNARITPEIYEKQSCLKTNKIKDITNNEMGRKCG